VNLIYKTQFIYYSCAGTTAVKPVTEIPQTQD